MRDRKSQFKTTINFNNGDDFIIAKDTYDSISTVIEKIYAAYKNKYPEQTQHTDLEVFKKNINLYFENFKTTNLIHYKDQKAGFYDFEKTGSVFMTDNTFKILEPSYIKGNFDDFFDQKTWKQSNLAKVHSINAIETGEKLNESDTKLHKLFSFPLFNNKFSTNQVTKQESKEELNKVNNKNY